MVKSNIGPGGLHSPQIDTGPKVANKDMNPNEYLPELMLPNVQSTLEFVQNSNELDICLNTLKESFNSDNELSSTDDSSDHSTNDTESGENEKSLLVDTEIKNTKPERSNGVLNGSVDYSEIVPQDSLQFPLIGHVTHDNYLKVTYSPVVEKLGNFTLCSIEKESETMVLNTSMPEKQLNHDHESTTSTVSKVKKNGKIIDDTSKVTEKMNGHIKKAKITQQDRLVNGNVTCLVPNGNTVNGIHCAELNGHKVRGSQRHISQAKQVKKSILQSNKSVSHISTLTNGNSAKVHINGLYNQKPKHLEGKTLHSMEDTQTSVGGRGISI